MKPSGKAPSLRPKPTWEPLDSVAPRAMLKLCVQGPVDRVTGKEVNPWFAALEAVVSLAAEDTVDCKY